MTRNKSKKEGLDDTVEMISNFGISPFDLLANK